VDRATRTIGLVATFLAAAALHPAATARAAALPFTATLAIEIATVAPLVVSGSGTAIANGSGGGSHIVSLALAGSTFAATGVVQPITDPGAFPIGGVQLTAHNQSGAFSGGGALGGAMPLAGFAKVCLFGPCASAVSNLIVPLSVVGQDDVAFVTGGAVSFSVVGAPWTTGTAAVGTFTAMGGAHGPASSTSSTFASGGSLQLVAPFFASTAISTSQFVPSFAILTLHFVPEPGTLVLLGTGIVVLVRCGQQTRKRG
jgi:hypothetical protein